MSLQAELLRHVDAVHGVALSTLRAKVRGHGCPVATDAAIIGLRRSGQIHLCGVRVMAGPMRPLPDVSPEAIEEQIAIRRAIPSVRHSVRDPAGYRLKQMLRQRTYRARIRAKASADLAAEAVRREHELTAIRADADQPADVMVRRLRDAKARSKAAQGSLLRKARMRSRGEQ